MPPAAATPAQQQRRRGVPLGVTRIGINSGEAVIGNFGGAHYFDYTAFGDAVNVAARLERANKLIGTRICIGEAVVARASGFVGRPIGSLLLRGKTRTLRCYEPLDPSASARPARYGEAFALLEAGDPRSRQAFAALVGETDDDPLALFHLARLLRGEAGCEIALTDG